MQDIRIQAIISGYWSCFSSDFSVGELLRTSSLVLVNRHACVFCVTFASNQRSNGEKAAVASFATVTVYFCCRCSTRPALVIFNDVVICHAMSAASVEPEHVGNSALIYCPFQRFCGMFATKSIRYSHPFTPTPQPTPPTHAKRAVKFMVDVNELLPIHPPHPYIYIYIYSPLSRHVRYMHGPIPMKVESCRVEVLRACLSPLQILRQGSFQAKLIGLRTFGRRTHEDEWDEVRACVRIYVVRGAYACV